MQNDVSQIRQLFLRHAETVLGGADSAPANRARARSTERAEKVAPKVQRKRGTFEQRFIARMNRKAQKRARGAA